MFRDIFLKFESQEQADELLFDLVDAVLDAEGNEVQPAYKKPKFVNTDVIGDIYRPTGEMTEIEGPDGETIEVPAMEKIEGYHVNVRVTDEDTSTIDEFAVQPKNPQRVWA